VSYPVITTYTPANLETSVPNNSVVEVTFDQQMDPATISTLTMILSIDGEYMDTVSRTVVYNPGNKKATVSPSTYLANNTTYRMLVVGATDPDAAVLTGVKNLSGEPMVGNISWTFTTGENIFVEASGDSTIYATPDSTGTTDYLPLLVESTDPEDLAYNVPLDQVIAVEFNDDLWVENVSIVETLPSGAYADPTGWLTNSITMTSQAVLGSEFAGFTPAAPQFSLYYDSDVDTVYLTPTSTGYVDSYYNGGSYVQGTATAGRWEQSSDYTVTILKDRIKGLNTTIMDSNYEFLFTSLMVPMYISVEVIRLSLGSIIDGVPDNTIAVLIHRNSIRAQQLGSFSYSNPPLYVREYVDCKTKLDLLNSIFLGAGTLGGGRRTLGDMTIEKDSGGSADYIIPILEQLGACVDEKEEEIITQGIGVGAPMQTTPHILAADPYPGRAWSRLGSPDSVNDRLLKPGTTNRNRDNPPYPFRIARSNL